MHGLERHELKKQPEQTSQDELKEAINESLGTEHFEENKDDGNGAQDEKPSDNDYDSP